MSKTKMFHKGENMFLRLFPQSETYFTWYTWIVYLTTTKTIYFVIYKDGPKILQPPKMSSDFRRQ
jgi:hypothetical protein